MALVPAGASPSFVKLSQEDARRLLRESGAWFIRYSSDPSENETEWYYIICDRYDKDMISSKIRQNINRGKRDCYVRRLDVNWFVDHGYECYVAAYSRYSNACPSDKDKFRKNALNTIGGPFEYWGVFIGDALAGFCQCIIEGEYAITSATKYDPKFLRNRTAYALVNHMIEHYVVERSMTISNGNRSIAHDTNYQDVLVSMGFRKQFCRLNVIYHPWLKVVVQALFPFRGQLGKIGDRKQIRDIQSLLSQEELRRKCNVAFF